MASFDLGRRIQNLLNLKDKSQSDLARYLGIKASTVSQWISGKANPTFDKLESIAHFFRMSLPDLVSDIDPSDAASPHMTVINSSSDIMQIPFGASVRVEIGTQPDIGDIVLYRSGDLMRFLRLAAYKDGISVLMSDLDNDPPVIATQESEILGTATAILLKAKKEPDPAGTESDSLSENKDKFQTPHYNTSQDGEQ